MAVRHMVSGTGFIATVLVNVCSALACDLPVGEGAMVASVEDGETLVLTDGRKVRLAGIKAPSPPLGWKGEEPWPFVAEAKKALSALATDQEVELKFDERQTDRYGHILAQVYVVREDLAPMWLEERLVRDGFARVYSFSDARACTGELLAVEGEARVERRGLWSSWAYRVQNASDAKGLGRLTNSYQLVEGTVHAVGEGRKFIYLNFSDDWRHDFTVAIRRKDLAAFEAAGLDLEKLAGRTIRVRGWIEWQNGPIIVATHPEQLEVLTLAFAP